MRLTHGPVALSGSRAAGRSLLKDPGSQGPRESKVAQEIRVPVCPSASGVAQCSNNLLQAQAEPGRISPPKPPPPPNGRSDQSLSLQASVLLPDGVAVQSLTMIIYPSYDKCGRLATSPTSSTPSSHDSSLILYLIKDGSRLLRNKFDEVSYRIQPRHPSNPISFPMSS